MNGTIDDFVVFKERSNIFLDMKKISSEKKAYLKKRHIIKRIQTIKIANFRKMRTLKAKKYSSIKNINYLQTLKQGRKIFLNDFYKKVKYKNAPRVVELKGSIGLELDSDIESYFMLASSFIDSYTRKIEFKFKECTRIWPSGIALLCSFKQWVEITSHKGNIPKLLSSDADDHEVNAYLHHCGFYDYVNRVHPSSSTDIFADKEIVKIHREIDSKKMFEREDEILELLQEFSTLNDEELEKFGDVVLTEVFNNVDEHGYNHIDKGWWTITQRHPQTEIISLSVADNGIGVKNSLKTGPQKFELEKRFGKTDPKDGKYLLASFEENVSGAIKASQKNKRFLKSSYEKGARRGNGLNRIREACKDCNIKFNIISQDDFLCMNENGDTKKLVHMIKEFLRELFIILLFPQKKRGIYETN